MYSEGVARRALRGRAAADTASIRQLPVGRLALFCCTIHHSAACGSVTAERLILRARKQKLEQKHIRGVPVAQEKGECKFDLSPSPWIRGRPLTPQRKGREGLSAASRPAGSLEQAGLGVGGLGTVVWLTSSQAEIALGATLGRWEVGIF